MYKIIACDWGETLIRSDRTMSNEDKDAIAAARARGVHFVPATGRGYESVDVTLAELGMLDAAGGMSFRLMEAALPKMRATAASITRVLNATWLRSCGSVGCKVGFAYPRTRWSRHI